MVLKTARLVDRLRVLTGAPSLKILQVTDIHLSGFIPWDFICIKQVHKLVEGVLGEDFLWTFA